MTDETSNRIDQQQEKPGGGQNRGQEHGTVGEVQADVLPPYDELRGPPSAEGAEGVRRAFDASHAPAPDSDVPESAEERKGMSSAEMNPEPPLGVGKAHGKGAEDQAPDRSDTGTKGPAQRPVGTAAEGSGTGVDPKPTTTPGSPNLSTS